MSESRYIVREDRAVVFNNPSNPDDFSRVPCWTVTRVNGDSGWEIGKYKTKEAAEWIANELQGFAAQEIS